MSNERRVVVTGIGPVYSIGIGKDEFFQNLYQKKACIIPIDEESREKYKVRSTHIVPYPNIPMELYREELAKTKRRCSDNAYGALISTLLAKEDAKIDQFDDNTAVIFGMGMINMNELTTNVISHEAEHKVSGTFIPTCMSNSASAWISILFGIHGKNYTISSACTSGTNAVGEAFEQIKYGNCNMAICGGTECITKDNYAVIKGFENLRSVTSSEDGYPKPFSEERSGFLFSQGGSCTLILEELESALKRNAFIYAEITDYQSNCDGYNIVMMPEKNEALEKMLSDMLHGEKLDYYNAHGTGTKLNDSMEEELINSVFGKENQPYIGASKSIMGHSIGAGGAFEACICAKAISDDKIHGNIVGTVSEDFNIVKDTISCPVNTAVSSSFGFGGHNAMVMFRKFKN